jgi:hypothetical protein
MPSRSAPAHQVERQLVAIFAADIAGYSRLIEADEEESRRKRSFGTALTRQGAGSSSYSVERCSVSCRGWEFSSPRSPDDSAPHIRSTKQAPAWLATQGS